MEEEMDEAEELWYEPEWCEDCSTEMPQQGIEYTFDYHVEGGVYICDHCGKPI